MKSIAMITLCVLMRFVVQAQDETQIQRLFKECGGVYFTDRSQAFNFFKPYIETINLQKRDSVVSIGVRSATLEISLSAFSDSVHFVLENIDSTCLNKIHFSETLNVLSSLYNKNLTNTFAVHIGTEFETNLKFNSFNKVILGNSLHEFVNIPEMIRNIHSICKKYGILYVIERLPLKKYELHSGCNRMMLDEIGVRDRIEAFGFDYLGKKIVGHSAYDTYIYLFKKR